MPEISYFFRAIMVLDDGEHPVTGNLTPAGKFWCARTSHRRVTAVGQHCRTKHAAVRSALEALRGEFTFEA